MFSTEDLVTDFLTNSLKCEEIPSKIPARPYRKFIIPDTDEKFFLFVRDNSTQLFIGESSNKCRSACGVLKKAIEKRSAKRKN